MKLIPQEEEISRFIPEIANDESNPRDSIVIRCFRKKYNCIMFFLLVAFLALQTLSLLISKLDDDQIQSLTKKFYRNIKLLLLTNHNKTSHNNISDLLEYD
jgi:hypothetical protein